MNVLVVDDEPLVRHSLRRALQKSGHQVAEAVDGRQALELWPSFKPDLVYLDVLMPGLSGPEMLKELGAPSRQQAKIILMSAFTGGYDLEKAKSMGADLFIAKPFEDIFATIRSGEELVNGR